MLSTMTAPRPRDAVLGERLSTLRDAAGLSQSHVAQAMGKLGFRWGRVTVAQVETGRRPLTLWEAVAVVGILNTREIEGARGPIRLADLVPEAEAITDLYDWQPLVEQLQTRRRFRTNLDEWTKAREHRWQVILGRPPEYPRQIGTDAEGRPTFSTPDPPSPDWVDQQMLLDAEGKAALALKVPVEAVVLASWKCWQTSLTQKREQGLAEHPGRSGDDERRDQALRGHVTRKLLAELDVALAPLRRRKRRKS